MTQDCNGMKTVQLKAIGRMIKADPLSPLGYYVRNMVIPGMGLLLEG